jgi:hypothetical protein
LSAVAVEAEARSFMARISLIAHARRVAVAAVSFILHFIRCLRFSSCPACHIPLSWAVAEAPVPLPAQTDNLEQMVKIASSISTRDQKRGTVEAAGQRRIQPVVEMWAQEAVETVIRETGAEAGEPLAHLAQVVQERLLEDRVQVLMQEPVAAAV